MTFNSLTYLFFLAAFAVLYWRLPRQPRLFLIFAGSLLFYGFWRFEFIAILFLSIGTDYLAALGMSRTTVPWKRRLLLFASLSVNLGLLVAFKYLHFVVSSVNGVSAVLGLNEIPLTLQLVLPLGISFYTFQSISYTVDVYRGFIRPERNFIIFANFVLFFPQLIAGPILRAREVMDQLVHRPPFNSEDVAEGIRRVLAGLFLKVVMADTIAPLVDKGFASPPELLSGFDIWTLALLFGFQIYFDFSAYSHIAIGSARILGIRFPENFDFPYLASSPTAFWRRWHISLGSWVRDYLYLPLSGARVRGDSRGGLGSADLTPTEGRRSMALLVTWLLMGLWHGANWTFVVWGLWHGALVLGHRLIGPVVSWRQPTRAVFGWMVTLPLVMLGWIPFRAQNLSDVWTMLGAVITPTGYLAREGEHTGRIIAGLRFSLEVDSYYIAAALLAATVATFAVARWVIPGMRQRPYLWISAETCALAVVTPLVFVFLRPIRQFIYFQF